MNRKPIGFVTATVTFPIYEGDRTDHLARADYYEYVEPGINENFQLSEVRRHCKLVDKATITITKEN